MRKPNLRFILLLILSVGILMPLSADTTPPAAAVKPKKKLTLRDLLNSTTGYSKHSTTVAGVRGLEETNGTIDTKARNYVAIEKLEGVVISPDDLKKFLDEGKLR